MAIIAGLAAVAHGSNGLASVPGNTDDLVRWYTVAEPFVSTYTVDVS